MSITAPLAASGTIRRLDHGALAFCPGETNYEHLLDASPELEAQIGRHVRGVIRAKARKVYTVPSGGNFVQPIFGSPRIVQGRVLSLDETSIIVKAGAVFVIELPVGLDTIDLHTGNIAANVLVNAVVLPGARFELVR